MATVDVSLTIEARSRLPRISIRGTNLAPDHRLRLGFATGISSPQVWADAAFGPVPRAPIIVCAEDTMETPPPTAPLHRYVSLFSSERGTTVISDGLGEYEVTEEGIVFITLVRAVGELSHNDLPERPGHAGWPVATPAAQSLGPFAASFALLQHGPRSASVLSEVEEAAENALLPLKGTTLRSALEVPDVVSGVELRGRGLAFSAMKESEDGEWMVLRSVNLTDEMQDGAWVLGVPVREAMLARLDETPLEPIIAEGNVVRFRAMARQIVTVLVR